MWYLHDKLTPRNKRLKYVINYTLNFYNCVNQSIYKLKLSLHQRVSVLSCRRLILDRDNNSVDKSRLCVARNNAWKHLPQDAFVRWVHRTAERTLPSLRKFRVVRQRADHSKVIRRMYTLYYFGLERSVCVIATPNLKKKRLKKINR